MCFALEKEGELQLNDLDLRLKRSQIALAEDDSLLQPLLFLQDAFPFIVEQPLGRQRPRAGQTGEHDLCRQFWFLVLHVGFALLQSTPGLVQTFGTRQKRLYLQLEFDALAPQEFASLRLGMARWQSILILLAMMLVVVMVSLVAMGWLLIAHEKPHSFPVALCSSRFAENKQHESRQNQPLMSF
jgi:hypothetical protein